MSSWELEHQWEIVRYLVYYLRENLVPSELIEGKDIVDFSTGLGDLSLFMAEHGAKSVTATVPEDISAPKALEQVEPIRFLPKMAASQISERLGPESADLFVGRMVFQFPTEEADRIDVDGMLAQIFEVLRPGGRLIIASHQYSELDRQVQGSWKEPIEDHFEKLLSSYADPYRQQLKGLIELISTIGIPPREGNHGQSGFGLKPLMTIDSFVRAGFAIERAAELEDFTFPIGLSEEIGERPEYYANLAKQVFEIKREGMGRPSYADKYERPQVLQRILEDINQLHPVATIPIFAIQARKN